MDTVAIIGAGNMGRTHAGKYAQIPGVRVSHVVDAREDAARALAEQLGCDCATEISRIEPGEADMIDICLPTFLHRDAIFQAADICRDIICEKPLALNLAQVREIEALIREKGLRLMVAQVVRFMSQYALARSMAAEGAVGRVNSVTCYRRQKKPDWVVGNWLSDAKRSGGMAYDLAIHDLDYIAWLLGMPERLYANAAAGADGGIAHLKTELDYGGCAASIFSSWDMPAGFYGGELCAKFEIVGEGGLISGGMDGKMEFCGEKGTRGIPCAPNDGYLEELRYFVECHRQNRAPEIASVAAVRGALVMAEAINVSLAEGRAVTMKDMEELI